MSGITFQYRTYQTLMDAGFNLYNGLQIGDVSAWHVGDKVSVCFPDCRDKIEAINRNSIHRLEFACSGDLLQIPCVVMKRRHSIVFNAVGRFNQLCTCSVVLEAESDQWEDVLRWVVLNQKPRWLSNAS